MEWITCIRLAVDFMEDHMRDRIGIHDVSNHVHLSESFFIRGFSAITGCSPGEYLRSRRLFLAALDLQQTDKAIQDIATDYGYSDPQSFTRAFVRFHGATPKQVREGAAPKGFFSLTIRFTIEGKSDIDVTVKQLFGDKVIGFQKIIGFENADDEIAAFWEEIFHKYLERVYSGKPPSNSYEKAVVDNRIGEFGVCIDRAGEESFRYIIAGKYSGGDIPDGMEIHELPGGFWAVFNCYGPVPEAIRRGYNRVFGEWLPGNAEYELSGNACVEWYDIMCGSVSDQVFHSAIWVPVIKKRNETI